MPAILKTELYGADPGAGGAALRNPSRVDGSGGFTLIEVLVAVSIAAVLMGAILATLTANLDAIETVRSGSRLMQTARIALARMTRDLESAFVAAGGETTTGYRTGLIGTSLDVGGTVIDRVDLTTIGCKSCSAVTPMTDLVEVGYRLVEDTDRGPYVLLRRFDFSLDDEITEGGVQELLADRVAGLRIRYRNRDGEEFDTWQGHADADAGRLPALVTIELVLADGDQRTHRFMTSVHPVLQAAAGVQ